MTHPWVKVLLTIVLFGFYGGHLARFTFVAWKRKNASSFDEWDKYNTALNKYLQAVAFVIVTALFLVTALWLNKHGGEALKWTVAKLGLGQVQYLVTVAVCGLGLSAYYLKTINQRRYGAIETIFGFVASVIAIKHVEADKFFPTLATLGGCIYIIARGCSNFFDAAENTKKPDPYIARLDAELSWNKKHRPRATKQLNPS